MNGVQAVTKQNRIHNEQCLHSLGLHPLLENGGRERGRHRETKRESDWLNDWTLLHKDKGLGTNACRSTCPWNSCKHIYIYMIIVGKSMPIDNYEQYKRVINQITGRLYMHIYILETKIIIFYVYFYFFRGREKEGRGAGRE